MTTSMGFVSLSQLISRIAYISDPVLKGKVTKAISILHRTFALYRLEHISLSFNGGKDSTVLLHLLRVALVPQGLTIIQEHQRLSGSGEAPHYLRRGSSSGTAPTAAAAAAGGPVAGTAGGGPATASDGQAAGGVNSSSSSSSSCSNKGAQYLATQAQLQAAAASTTTTAAAAAADGAAAIDLDQGVAAEAEAGLSALTSFYFERQDDFPEVRDFVHEIDKLYALTCHFLANPDFKGGLVEFLEQHQCSAIVLGTRRGDPNAEGQEYFCPSSDGWPPFMRVNPILDWTYHDVWSFLRATGVGYCSLYDQGYTSLGGVHNTLPNSALKKSDGTFAPAHMLVDGRLERVGRATQQRRAESMVSSPEQVTPDLTLRAGIVMVGDELLSGKVEDTNTPFLCKELHQIGWVVRRVVVVPDDVAAIAAEVAAMSCEVEVVITGGGVGPTLDDVTMDAVAQAFGTNLVRHPELEESLLQYFGRHITAAHLKLADIPEADSTLLPYTLDNGDPSPFPVVRCRNVFILPGVPHLLRQKWRVVRCQLLAQGALAPFANRLLRLSCEDEAVVAPLLDQLAAEWGSEVTLGSYPVTGQADGARLLLFLEGKQAEVLDCCLQRLLELLTPGVVLGQARDVASLALQQVGNGGGSKSGSRRGSFQLWPVAGGGAPGPPATSGAAAAGGVDAAGAGE